VGAAALLLALASAALHVGWNRALREASGDLGFVWRLTWAAGAAGLVLGARGLGTPHLWRAWPYLAVAVPLNAAYFAALGRLYARGALSWAYPLARGWAVALAVPVASAWLGPPFGANAALGLGFVLVGAAILAGEAGRAARTEDLLWALAVGGAVAGYSVVDAAAVRTAPPVPYAALEYLGSAAALAPWARRARAPSRPWPALGAGLVSLVSYALLLEAYRLGPAGAALAVRQAAPVLALLVGRQRLGERLSPARVAGALAVAAGAALLARAG
jgi:drug/metabolite transporter (DMT)-like permease